MTRTLSWNLLARYRNCRMKLINCMNDSKDFQDAESIRSGNSRDTSRLVSFPPHPIPGGMLSCSVGMPSRREWPPSIWDTHGISGNVLQIQRRHLQNLIHKNCISGIHHAKSRFTHPQWKRVRDKNKIKIRDASLDSQPKILSSTVEETLQRIVGQTNNDCRFWIFILTNSLHQPRLLDGTSDSRPRYGFVHNSLRKLCTGSKKVEMVEWVDDLMSSSSVRGIQMPNFEVLDARMVSALNRIIHNSHFKRRISLEEQEAQKQDRFLRGRQIAYLIYKYFRVIGANDSVENYADLFTIVLRMMIFRNSIQSGDGLLLSMTKIPPDGILEGLYKLRIRESEKLKTVLKLYDLEIH